MNWEQVSQYKLSFGEIFSFCKENPYTLLGIYITLSLIVGFRIVKRNADKLLIEWDFDRFGLYCAVFASFAWISFYLLIRIGMLVMIPLNWIDKNILDIEGKKK